MAKYEKKNYNKNKSNNKQQRGSRGKNNRKAPQTLGKRPKHDKLEIKFDPEARKTFLTGASARKQEKRAYGLAMQKVKDRRAKIDQRREEKKAMIEKIEEAERIKKDQLFDDYDSEDDEDNNVKKDKKVEDTTKVEKYEDESTQNQFGGQVIVTTSFGVPSDESDEEDTTIAAITEEDGKGGVKRKIDSEQRFAGSVQKYMAQLQKKMPPKGAKFKAGNGGRAGKKGMHGAQGMIGGNAKDLKMAKKTLSRAEGNNKRGGGTIERGGKRGKKGKGRR
jgi:hypothetical protein